MAKSCLGPSFDLPIILGNGLKYAESIVKSDQTDKPSYSGNSTTLNLEGMECRWDQITPPKNKQEVVCLLVEVDQQDLHAEIFSKVLKKIDETYGSKPQRNPITLAQLRLNPHFAENCIGNSSQIWRAEAFILIKILVLYPLLGLYIFDFIMQGKIT